MCAKNVLYIKNYGHYKKFLEIISYDQNYFENKVVEAAAKVSLATVYQKHSSLRTRKWMYRG